MDKVSKLIGVLGKGGGKGLKLRGSHSKSIKLFLRPPSKTVVCMLICSKSVLIYSRPLWLVLIIG